MFSAIIERCNEFAQSWAWWVGMSILDAAIVLAIVSLVWWAIRRKAPAQLGYLLFLLVLLKLFVPLYISVPERFFAWAPLTAARGIGQEADPTAPPSAVPLHEEPKRVAHETVVSMPAPREMPRSMVSAEPVIIKRTHPSLLSWLMFAWLAGLFALVTRLVLAQARFQRSIVRRAHAVDPFGDTINLGKLLTCMRIKGTIRIVESDRLSSPVVWGIVRPTLILPVGFAKSMSPRQLEWVVLHELAHVRRRDLVVNCFQRVAGILHFVNPSIWIANRVIDRLREYACDDLASAYGRISQVESGEAFLGVMRYAAAIQRQPESHLEGALGMFELSVRASCFKRMTRLLDTNRRLSVKIRRGSLCLLLLTAALALPQIRAASPQPAEEAVKSAAKAEEKKGAQKPAVAGLSAAEKKLEAEKDQKAAFRFSVVIARHVMLLDGKEIVTWPQIEEKIAKRPNPSLTLPSFYITRGATEAGKYESAKTEIWRLHQDYKLVGHSEGSLAPRADLRYDRIQTGDDLKADESQRIEGIVVKDKEEPVAGAEVVLVTPVDSSISYKAYEINLVQGRVYNPLEEVMTSTDERGRFGLYPPKGQSYSVIALHPDGGFNLIGSDQFSRDRKIHLLKWAGLVTDFSQDAEKQTASLQTRIKETGDRPEINLSLDGNHPQAEEATHRFRFVHVPPIFETTIYRNFPDKEGVSFCLPGASVGLLPGETRELNLGPLSKQQREQLVRMRRDSEERRKNMMREPEKPSVPKAKAGSKPAPSAAAMKATDIAAKSAQPFVLTLVGPEGKPVPDAEVEFRTDAKLNAEQVQRGKYLQKSTYGFLVQADGESRIELSLSQKPKRLEIHVEKAGYGPFWAAWNSADHPNPIPEKFTVELDAGWSVGGVIVDDQGKPIEGAKIHPSIKFKKPAGDANELYVGTQLTTDAEGRWQFGSVPVSMKEVYVEINHPDFKPNRSKLSRSKFGIGQENKPTAKITMQRGLTIRGKVTDEAGKPISGATIRTKFANDLREAKTNERGEYRLIGCEPKMAKIVVSAKGRATDKKEVRVAADMEPVNFTMEPGGKVRIRVLDESGNPASHARIFFNHWRDPFYDYFEFDIIDQYADKDGVWQWNEAPLDEFKADICPPNGMQLLDQSMVAREEEYVFRTFPLLVITGSVVDAETKQPVKSFRVVPGARWPTQEISWDRSEGYLASDGQYGLQRNRGELAHRVRIEADGYKVAVSREIKSDEGKVKIDFALTKGKDVAATVLTPDGKPVVGAKIALGIAGSQISVTNGNIDDRSTYASRQETDSAGRFHFPPQNDAYQLVITHASGHCSLKSPEQEIPSTITLAPWAKVEGTFRVGAKVMPNVGVALNVRSIEAYGDDVPHIFTQHKATTGSDGHFSFERVFPGKGRIGREIILMVKDGALEVTSSSMIAADFPAGKITHIDLGGTGRAVIGKLAPPVGNNENVLWNFATIDLRPAGPKLPIPAGMEKDPEQRKAWMDAWETTAEGKAWQETYEAYQKLREASPYIWATVDRDGTFRIDDVPPGEYELDVRFSEHSVGHLVNYRFTVSPIEDDQAGQPLDLGKVVLEKN